MEQAQYAKLSIFTLSTCFQLTAGFLWHQIIVFRSRSASVLTLKLFEPCTGGFCGKSLCGRQERCKLFKNNSRLIRVRPILKLLLGWRPKQVQSGPDPHLQSIMKMLDLFYDVYAPTEWGIILVLSLELQSLHLNNKMGQLYCS